MRKMTGDKNSNRLVIVIILILLILFSIIKFGFEPIVIHNIPIQDAPAYLLLSNWKNAMIYIATGIQIPNSTLNGERGFNTSVRAIFFDGKLYNEDLYVDYGQNTESVRLTLNNTIIIKKSDSTFEFIFPPFLDSFLINSIYGNNTFLFENVNNYSIINGSGYKQLNVNRISFFVSNHSDVNIDGSNLTVYNTTFIEGSMNSSYINPNLLLNYSINSVKVWLLRSRNVSLPGNLSKEYYRSLLLIKDDQNPLTGEFVASPEPVYFYSWARDSAFAALSLQSSGHIASALHYWRFLSNFMVNKTFYTRFNFWNGAPDESYGIPEYDSIGLFQIGIYDLYNETGNISIIYPFIGALNSTFLWESQHINGFDLLPRDLSIWEDNMAYNFWTQAIDAIGLKLTADLYKDIGLNYSLPLELSIELNRSIQDNFYRDGFFVQSLTKGLEYVNGSNEVVLIANPFVDSSLLLPLAFGLLPLNSTMVVSSVKTVNSTLSDQGFLSRFKDDDYHFSQDLYDSSGPSPPWIITSLFLGYYYDKIGDYSGAIKLLNLSTIHSNNGILPEAVDPNSLSPLPTTSPLTWSAAMFVLVSINCR